MGRFRTYRYHLAALFTVSVWGATFVSTKVLIARGLSPEWIFFIRFAVAYVLILFAVPRPLRLRSATDEALAAAAGVTGGSLYFLTENIALEYAPASNVSLIVCTAPVWTALLLGALDRRERMSRRQIAGSALAFAGMTLVVLNGRFVLRLSPAGDLLALAAALLWMVYSLVVKRIVGRYPALLVTRKIFFYGLLTILPVVVARPLDADAALFARPDVWGTLLFLGVVASMLCYLIWNAVIRRLGAVRATNYIYFNPLVTMLTAWLCIGERITAAALAGAALILGGMWITERDRRDR
ncbi:MAG: DMT family transporter [Alistipes sp.]|nr:DMT family transporter [Alistipes sp.]